jgi:NAD(P)-dependent dehydrogenase (short-subunit alcohol dehydrogenase family)
MIFPGRFKDQTVLVTGASSGIGLATALRLQQEGARVVAVGRSLERLGGALGVEKQSLRMEVADVAREPDVKELAERLRADGVVLGGLLHCAGEHALRPLKLLGAEDILRMCASHVVSSVLLCRYLAASRIVMDGGSIVLLASAAALRGGSGTVAYAAAKAGVIAAARSLASELAPRQIRVNTVSPGVVRTQQGEALLRGLPAEKRDAIESEHPLGLGTPEDVAALLAFLLSAETRWMTGTNVTIDGGLTLG